MPDPKRFPEDGDVVVFEGDAPAHLRSDVRYRVERRGRDFLFVGPDGHSAWLAPFSVALAKWSVAPVEPPAEAGHG